MQKFVLRRFWQGLRLSGRFSPPCSWEKVNAPTDGPQAKLWDVRALGPRPLLAAGKPELCEYKRVYVLNHEGIGLFNDEAVVNCAP